MYRTNTGFPYLSTKNKQFGKQPKAFQSGFPNKFLTVEKVGFETGPTIEAQKVAVSPLGRKWE